MGNNKMKTASNLNLALGLVAIVSIFVIFVPYVSTIILIPIIVLSIMILIKGNSKGLGIVSSILCLSAASCIIISKIVQLLAYEFYYYINYETLDLLYFLSGVGFLAILIGGILAIVNSSKINKEIQKDRFEELIKASRLEKEKQDRNDEVVEQSIEIQQDQEIDIVHAEVKLEESTPVAVAATEEQKDAEVKTANSQDERKKTIEAWENMIGKMSKKKSINELKGFYIALIIMGVISIIPIFGFFLFSMSFGSFSIIAIVVAAITLKKMNKEKKRAVGPIFAIISQAIGLCTIIPIIVVILRELFLDEFIYVLSGSYRYSPYLYISTPVKALIAISWVLNLISVIICIVELVKINKEEKERQYFELYHKED